VRGHFSSQHTVVGGTRWKHEQKTREKREWDLHRWAEGVARTNPRISADSVVKGEAC